MSEWQFFSLVIFHITFFISNDFKKDIFNKNLSINLNTGNKSLICIPSGSSCYHYIAYRKYTLNII